MKPVKRRRHVSHLPHSDRTPGHANDHLNIPIRDVMTREVVCVFGDLGIDTLETLLLERDVSGVPVIDREHRLIGYVATTDVMRAHHDCDDALVVAERDTWGFHTESAPKTVAEVMTPVAFELQESCPLAVAVELMTSRQVHRVPVVSDDGVLVGIVSADDILRFLAHDGNDAQRDDHATQADRVMSLGFLTGGLAHQVNNALTPMRLSLGRLASFELSRRPLTPERMHRIELLQDVREGLDRVERIVRALKVFSHADDTPGRPIDVCEALEAAIAVADHEIRHRAELVRDFGEMPRVSARAEDLRQVFLNLLINAVHAVPEGEAHIHEIRVATCTDEQGHAAIEITDTGSGISPDAIPRIFEPFFTTQPGRALGLGLAVTRDIVNAIGGTISVDSVVGKGTTVRIALPPCEDDKPTLTHPAQAAARQDAETRLRILIIDDDRPVAAAIALELEDHDVVVAESGRGALEILRHDKDFDVILCDLMMPEVSGIDVYESVRLLDPALLGRVVMMTGGAFTHRAGEFLSSIAAPVLEKPFESGQLHAVITTLERRHEHARAAQVAADALAMPATLHERES